MNEREEFRNELMNALAKVYHGHAEGDKVLPGLELAIDIVWNEGRRLSVAERYAYIYDLRREKAPEPGS